MGLDNLDGTSKADFNEMKGDLLKAFREAADGGTKRSGGVLTNYDKMASDRSYMARFAQAYVAAAKEVRKTITEDVYNNALDTLQALEDMESKLLIAYEDAHLAAATCKRPENRAHAKSNIPELAQARVAVAKEARKTSKVAQLKTQQPIQAAVDREPPPRPASRNTLAGPSVPGER